MSTEITITTDEESVQYVCEETEQDVCVEPEIRMVHYLLVTDTNSRQYPIKIDPDHGLPVVFNSEKQIVLFPGNFPMSYFAEAMQTRSSITVNNSITFNTDNLVNVEYKIIPEHAF